MLSISFICEYRQLITVTAGGSVTSTGVFISQDAAADTQGVTQTHHHYKITLVFDLH